MKKKLILFIAIYLIVLVSIIYITNRRGEAKKQIIFSGYYDVYYKYLEMQEVYWDMFTFGDISRDAFRYFLDSSAGIGYYLFIINSEGLILNEHNYPQLLHSREVRSRAINNSLDNSLNYFSEVFEHQNRTYIFSSKKITNKNYTLVILSDITPIVNEWYEIKNRTVFFYSLIWSIICILFAIVYLYKYHFSKQKKSLNDVNELVSNIQQTNGKSLIILINEDSDIVSISSDFSKLLEYKEDELIGKNIKLLITGFNLSKFINLNEQQLEHEDGIEILSKTGRTFYLMMTYIPFFNNITEFSNILFLFKNITPIKKDISRLSFEIKKNESMLNICQLVMNVDDLAPISKMIIQEVRTLINFDFGTFFILREDNLYPIYSNTPEFEGKLETLVLKVGQGLAGNVAKTGISLIINDSDASSMPFQVDGTPIVQECLMSSPMKNSEGKIVGVVTFSRDGVNGFTNGDVQILETIAYHAANIFDKIELINRIKNEEKSHNTLVNESALAIIIIHEQKIIFCNKKFCEIIKYQKETLLGYDIIEFISKKDTNFFISQLTTFAISGSTDMFECEFITSENCVINLEFSLSSIVWEEQQSILISANDVTEKIVLNRRILQTQKLEALGTLTAGIAHDYKNILAGIMGAVEVILLKTDETSPIRSMANAIKMNAERAVKLSQRLLGFSRKDEDVTDLFDLNRLTKETVEIVSFTFEKNIIIEILQTDIPLYFEGDPIKIQQCIMNICVNARDVMPQGGKITIKTQYLNKFDEIKQLWQQAENRNYSLIEITDTGPGIPEHIIKMLFEPFFTTKEREKGTGLGLSITKDIIMGYKGDILIKSEVGVGTTFSILLPWFTQDDKVIKETTKSDSRKQQSVIIIDDEEIVLDIAKDMLEDLGCNVFTADNGFDGLKIISENPEISIAFLDKMMPKLDGLSLLKIIKERKPSMKVIVVSSILDDEDINDFTESGAYAVLSKPYRTDVLKQML